MDLNALAMEHGYVVEEMEVPLGDGRTRPGWLVFDLADQTFVHEAINWTTPAELEGYLSVSTG